MKKIIVSDHGSDQGVVRTSPILSRPVLWYRGALTLLGAYFGTHNAGVAGSSPAPAIGSKEVRKRRRTSATIPATKGYAPRDLQGRFYSRGSVPPATDSAVPTLPVAQRGSTFIYVLRRPDTGAVKIGRACDVSSRLHDLRVGNDVDLRLLLHFRAGSSDEARLHRMFAAFRKRGEWFHPAPPVLDWIARQARVEGVVSWNGVA